MSACVGCDKHLIPWGGGGAFYVNSKKRKLKLFMLYLLFPYSDGIDDFLCPYEGVEGREPLKASSHHSDGAEGGFGEGSGTLHCSAWNHIQKT